MVIPFYQVLHVYVFGDFLHIVRQRVPLPLNQVLQLTPTPMTLVVDNGLDLIFLLVFDQVRWWAREVRSMGSGLPVRQEEGGMEHVMDAL